jgi:hypothetical protein
MSNLFKAIGLSLVLTAPGVALADGAGLAAQGLQACAKVFPDGKKAAKAFKSLGFTSQGAVQGVETFLDSTSQVMVATSTQKGVPLRCMATASGLSVAQAKALAQSLMPLLQGAQDTGLSMAGIEAYFTGTLNGKEAGLVVAGPTGDGLGASVTLVVN